MKARINHFRILFTNTALLAIAMLVPSGATLADPVVDGNFDLGEGYDTVLPSGQAAFKETATSYFIYLEADRSEKDNTYGLNSVGYTSSSPFASDGNATANETQKFGELVGSDRTTFTFGNATFSLDYLDDASATAATVSGYGSGLFGSGFDDPAGAVLAAKSTMDYNLNVLVPGQGGDPDDYTDRNGGSITLGTGSSPNTTFNADGSIASEAVGQADALGWNYAHGFEFALDKSVVGSGLTFSDLSIDEAHWSPRKRGTTPPTSNATPEPSTAILAALGFAGLVGTRRRRRR